MKARKVTRYTCALITLLVVLTSNRYATTRIGHAVRDDDERINVAAAENGAVAIASSTLSDQFPASAIIDGDRKGNGWGAAGGWADDTSGQFPDSVEIDFADVMSINEVNLFTIQDMWWNPSEPTESMKFFNNGVTAFEVQYFDGSTWLPVPNGTISGNAQVWRKITFPAVIAEKIRVQINGSKAQNSILIEVEVYGVAASTPADPAPTPTPLPFVEGDVAAALAQHDIYIDENNDIGFGTQQPIFNDDGTTGAFVGKWFAIDGKLPGAAAYLGVGGTIPAPNERVGSLNFYNLAMGGADNRTAAIFSFNGAKLGTGNLEFYTSPNFIGPVRRMQIAPTGEIGINHTANTGTMLQVMGKTADASAYAFGVQNVSDRPLFTVRNDGQVAVGQPGQGIVLKSPNGQICKKLTIDDNGDLVVKPMPSCP
ncbi:MAG TPA: discoidin domain-containing protein [Pyrinomonadaceae bacterium]|nr:discoidin domain-containing protein [Pyrinomonadaceae bacterium]